MGVMREQGFKLTPLAPCDNPACGATVYAELARPNPFGVLCVACEDRHGERLCALADLFTRSGGRLPPDVGGKSRVM